MNHSSDKKFLQKKEILEIQHRKLCELMAYLGSNSPYYQKLFNTHRIDANEIRKPEDLVKIPTTSKEDLQLHNEEFLCVPDSAIIEYTSTSGLSLIHI